MLLSLAFTISAERRALVIGIGEYPDVDYGWHSINGDNDIDITKSLLIGNGFTNNNIYTLRNQQATYNNIIASLKRLMQLSEQNDIVYIHFSGHGQQITDLNGDEDDGFDEAWIPYDALQEPTDNYHGECHLTDDELNYYLHQIYIKIGETGRLIVVTDACHSGTSTRDITDTCTIRGTSAKFILSENNKSKNYTSQPIQWVAISACSDKECNRQYDSAQGLDKRQSNQSFPCGSLTYTLYLLRKQLTAMPLADLQQQLLTIITSILPRPQTPQVECPARYRHQTLLP